MVEILIASGNHMERKYMEMLMKKEGKKEYFVHSAKDLYEIEEICREEKIDLIVIDIDTVENLNGIGGAGLIKEQHPDMKIILITDQPECSYLERAKELQIDSFWYKDSEEMKLLDVVKQTMQDILVYPKQTRSVSIGNAMSSDFSKRELEVLREVVRGALDIEIAENMHISIRTVKTHIQHMRDKTGFRNRTELAVQARAKGLIINEN